MKKAILLSLALISSAWSFAQDTIVRADGLRVIGTITEISPGSVKTRTASGSVLETPKSNISYIAYKNGLTEIYNEAPKLNNATPLTKAEVAAAEKEAPRDFRKNMLSINCFEIMFTNLSLSYERFLPSGKFSVKIPVSVGLGGRPDRSSYDSGFGNSQFLMNRLYSGGLELNVYPLGQTRHTFYVGLGAVAGSFYYYHTDYSEYPIWPGYVETKHIGAHYAGHLHLGGIIRLSEEFALGGKLGLGYKREDTVIDDYTSPSVKLDLNFSYRF